MGSTSMTMALDMRATGKPMPKKDRVKNSFRTEINTLEITQLG